MNEHSIFLAALDITDLAERADYVNRTCTGDTALRRQVEALIAAHERSGEFLDVPVLQQIAACASAPSDHSNVPGAETSAERQVAKGEIDLSFLQPSTKPGSFGRLGHYEIEEVIGQGGCGIVLKAFDEILHRMVAIKVMAPELAATSPARKRFLREARAAAAIRHENVVSIHAVEEKPIPFLVMEYIASQTLQQKLDQNGPLDIPEVVRIGHQIANGLEAAHAIGLIHRDIKPGNILLEKDRDRIKITDFGLARASDDASITQSGIIAGTPLYMSPEQAQGAVIDQRSDLFSLGSVLYVMCSGRPPFRAATTLAVLKRVAEDQPRPIQEIIPETPEWLIAIIAKLLAKKPEDRFISAREVADLLARCLSELQHLGRVESLDAVLPMTPKPANSARESVESEHPRTEERPVPAPDKRRSLPRSRRWVAAAAMILVLLTGLGMTEATGLTNVRGTVIRLFSPDGTLVVEVDDPGVSVSIDGEDMVITGAGIKEIRLKPGQYKVLARKDGKVVSQELVTVTKNGRQVVRVSKEAAPVAAQETKLSPAKETPLPKVAIDPDPNRRAAEWVLSIGGKVDIRLGDVVFPINASSELPKDPFVLVTANLYGNTQITDAGFSVFEGCKGLNSLNLIRSNVTDVNLRYFQKCDSLTSLAIGHTQVTDRGLAYFKNCDALSTLNFGNSLIGDAGLAHFKNCKQLTELLLGRSRVTDAGLTHFKDCKNLTSLALDNNPRVTDVGLVNFKDCTNLTGLHLGGTKVGDAGLANFKNCKNLTNLTIGGTQVTDQGLAQFKDCKNLIELRLEKTDVTDAGLASFKESKNLRSVNLRDTKVTAEGVKKLAGVLPQCRIEWDGGVIEPTPPPARQTMIPPPSAALTSVVRRPGPTAHVRKG